MNSPRALVASLVVLLAVSACAPPLTIKVSATDGVTPEISFDGGNIANLHVYDMPGEDIEASCAPLGDGAAPRSFWSLRDPQNDSSIASPIVYGAAQATAIDELDGARELEPGSAVCVAVVRVDADGNREMGVLVHTP